jgi:hypothetical protein
VADRRCSVDDGGLPGYDTNRLVVDVVGVVVFEYHFQYMLETSYVDFE